MSTASEITFVNENCGKINFEKILRHKDELIEEKQQFNISLKTDCDEELLKSKDTYCLLFDRENLDKDQSLITLDEKVILVKGSCNVSGCGAVRQASSTEAPTTENEQSDKKTDDEKTTRKVKSGKKESSLRGQQRSVPVS